MQDKTSSQSPTTPNTNSDTSDPTKIPAGSPLNTTVNPPPQPTINPTAPAPATKPVEATTPSFGSIDNTKLATSTEAADEPAPFSPPTPAPVAPTPTEKNTDSVLSPAPSATLSTDSEKNEEAKVTSTHVPKKYGGGKVIATIFGILLIAGAVVAGVTLVQQRQLLEQQASSGSVCDQADDCFLYDNAPNTGSFDAPGVIKYADITDQDETRFHPGEVDDGCYKVKIDGNFISWEKYGLGPSCKDVSNVQIWYGPENTPTPVQTSTPTPVSTSTPTSPPNNDCKVELDRDHTAVCWLDARTEVPMGWKVASLPQTGGPYYLQTDWYIVKPNTGPHHYEKVGPVNAGQTGTIYADWPGVKPGQTEVSEIHYGLNVVDTNGNPVFANCSDGMDYFWTPLTCPAPTPTGQLSAQCSAVTAYDTSWNQLDVQTLSQLSAGQTIYLTVRGTASSGGFDKARFTVNGTLRTETTKTKPGEANVFYDEYTVPGGISTFTVGAQVHHSELGWF